MKLVKIISDKTYIDNDGNTYHILLEITKNEYKKELEREGEKK